MKISIEEIDKNQQEEIIIKCYELEEIFEVRNFFRASKSTIVNISKISSV